MDGKRGESGRSASANSSDTAVTPELVRQVADKVYAMWLRDLKIERDRQRPSANEWQRH
jgi:hypothetical protein